MTMAGGFCPRGERLGEHERDGPDGRREPTLLTSCAGSQGGGRKRRKKTRRYKCGGCRCCGIKRRIRKTLHDTQPGTDCLSVNGFVPLAIWSNRDKHNKVPDRNVNSLVSRSCYGEQKGSNNSQANCDKTGIKIASCDTDLNNVKHSKPESKVVGAVGPGYCDLRRSNYTSTSLHCYNIRRDVFFSILTCWLVTNALLVSTNTSYLAEAAAVPSPSTSSSRYKLVPPSQNNESIFIYFNPPSILSLKVNTRQSVFFNFTLRRRPTGFSTYEINNSHNNGINANSKSSTNKTPIADSNSENQRSDERLEVAQSDAAVGTSTTTPKATLTTTNLVRSNNSYSIPVSTLSPFSSSLSLSTSSLIKNQSYANNTSISTSKRSDGSMYRVMIYSDDDSIARPVISSPNGLAVAHVDSKGSYILMAVSAGRQHNFSVEARHIGRVTMSVAVVDVDGERRLPQASYVQAVAASQYPVTAVRGERTADLVFNSAAAAIAIIISFGIGAVTDTDSLKRQLKYPVALIIGFCCQFIIMPVMAFGLAMVLPLDKDIRFGLLCIACVPGGGLSHVAVIIADGDTALSLTMNLISVVAMLGTAPLWIFVLGQYFQTNPAEVLNPRMIPIYNFEIWLASTFFAYTAGLTVKRLRPSVADAILMWLIKPFLLLASILYITLGVYINMYVFELVNEYALLGAMLLPLCGCVVGGLMAAICRQNYAFVKTIALETSSLNCLVVMVALRFSLKQPDADLAAMIPIWVMFTIPGLFVFLAVCNKVKNVVLHYWNARNSKDNDLQNSTKAYSVSSSVVSPPGTTTLSAPLVVADGLDDDITVSTMSNQKVTVL